MRRGAARRITHEVQSLQGREVEGPSRDARELVGPLLKDGEGGGSEVTIVAVRGEAGRGGKRELGAERGASRTRYSVSRLVRFRKDPVGMLVSWLEFCSGGGGVGSDVTVEEARAGARGEGRSGRRAGAPRTRSRSCRLVQPVNASAGIDESP